MFDMKYVMSIFFLLNSKLKRDLEIKELEQKGVLPCKTSGEDISCHTALCSGKDVHLTQYRTDNIETIMK